MSSEPRQARTLAELRIENRALRRTIKRLEKELGRRSDATEELEEALEELADAQPTIEAKTVKSCPVCESADIKPFDTPNKRVQVCQDCRARF